ncbi:MAG: [FeFe] hydrogenase H-cluster radical SAM maturase HydE [Melioribacteraceae bacterium]|nr:[FeFe] hydrogenase H-cluster radical SAM maturase HydE [Melioribacteraceae bacterium]
MNGKFVNKELNKILLQEEFTKDDIVYLLSLEDEKSIEILFARADKIRKLYCDDEVHLRGVIEFSNFCEENCMYCGLRKDNEKVPRYRMRPDEIIETAKRIANQGIHTIVLQSGQDFYFDSDMISFLIYSIKNDCDVAITLSLGERSFEEYKAWKIAGADRYLLKHETSNPHHFSIYHDKQKLSTRLEHLKYLKKIGYQVGSGNMIGLPLQTIEDIADDILLCKELNIDMAAFGPFIPSPDTPYQNKSAGNAVLTLKAMAVIRIVLKDVHIPATTALDTIETKGREKGLRAGANVLMPNFTPNPYRDQYQIYPTSVRKDLDPSLSGIRMQNRIESIGRKVSQSKGDSLKMY